MIEVRNINPVNKNSLLATCDVYIKPWKYTFIGCKIFQKGAQIWVNMPSVEKDVNGEKKYIETGKWDSEAIHKRFKEQVMQAWDAYVAENPDLKQPDAIVDGEVPF